jgi:hypothetical protein
MEIYLMQILIKLPLKGNEDPKKQEDLHIYAKFLKMQRVIEMCDWTKRG